MMVELEKAEEIVTKEVKKARNTPLLYLGKELKWIGADIGDVVYIMKFENCIVIKKKNG